MEGHRQIIHDSALPGSQNLLSDAQAVSGGACDPAGIACSFTARIKARMPDGLKILSSLDPNR